MIYVVQINPLYPITATASCSMDALRFVCKTFSAHYVLMSLNNLTLNIRNKKVLIKYFSEIVHFYPKSSVMLLPAFIGSKQAVGNLYCGKCKLQSPKS